MLYKIYKFKIIIHNITYRWSKILLHSKSYCSITDGNTSLIAIPNLRHKNNND